MILFVFNFALALGFMALTHFTVGNFVLGWALGLAIIVIMPQLPNPRSIPFVHIENGVALIKFLYNSIFFTYDLLKDLTLSNIQIAWDVWTPRDYYDPEIIGVHVADLTNLQLAILASRITITPGTLSVDVSRDRQTLYVHVMYPSSDNPDEIAAGLRKPIEILWREV